MGQEAIQGGLQVGYLKREPNLAADPPAHLDLVDRTGLGFVEDLERGPAQVEQRCSTAIVRPQLRRCDAEAVAVETPKRLVVGSRDGDLQLENWSLLWRHHVGSSLFWVVRFDVGHPTRRWR